MSDAFLLADLRCFTLTSPLSPQPTSWICPGERSALSSRPWPSWPPRSPATTCRTWPFAGSETWTPCPVSALLLCCATCIHPELPLYLRVRANGAVDDRGGSAAQGALERDVLFWRGHMQAGLQAVRQAKKELSGPGKTQLHGLYVLTAVLVHGVS